MAIIRTVVRGVEAICSVSSGDDFWKLLENYRWQALFYVCYKQK